MIEIADALQVDIRDLFSREEINRKLERVIEGTPLGESPNRERIMGCLDVTLKKALVETLKEIKK